jgi:hypothetical protein
MKNEKKVQDNHLHTPGSILDLDDRDADRRHVGQDVRKPSDEGINNTDLPGVPDYKKAKNNPSAQDEGLSGYSGNDPLA